MNVKVHRSHIDDVAAQLTKHWNAAMMQYHDAIASGDQTAATWARSSALAFGQALQILFAETGEG